MDVERYMGYWLFYAHRCAVYVFAEGLRQVCIERGKPYVVTPSQWGVLTVLYEHDGLTAGTISQRRALDAPTITGIITRLEHSGLITRLRDDKDRRIVKIYLTDEGREIIGFLVGKVEELNEVMLQGFSERDVHDLREKMQHIVANLAESIPGSDNRWQLLLESFPKMDECGDSALNTQERMQKEG